MTPFKYLTLNCNYLEQINNPDSTLTEIKSANEKLQKLFSLKDTEFPLYNQSMNDGEYSFSPHDGSIHSLKFDKNGILHIKFSSIVYKDKSEEDFYQLFDIFMKLDKIPSGGTALKRDAIIMDIVFTEKEFGIHFLSANDHSKSFIESFDISAIDISKSSKIKHNRFIPKEFKNKNHIYFKP